MAISEYGLISNEIRRKAWAVLLNLNHPIISPEIEKSSKTKEEVKTKDSNTTMEYMMDDKNTNCIELKKVIGRSMYNFDFFNSLNEETSEKYKLELEEMIFEILAKNKFQYYQGYDELCSVFLLIMGKKLGTKAAEMVSKFFIKDFLMGSFDNRVRPMLSMMIDIVKVVDEKLYEKLIQIGVVALLINRFQCLECHGY